MWKNDQDVIASTAPSAILKHSPPQAALLQLSTAHRYILATTGAGL